MSAGVGTTAVSRPAVRTWISDYLELTKPRITLFVAWSALVGFAAGSPGPLRFELLVPALIGTMMVSAGTAALNQLIERDLDARMVRTAHRPLPAGRLGPDEAHCLGVMLSAAGLFYLGIAVNLLTGLIAAATLGIYLFAYTPLKLKTPFNTAVGAVAGALPPVGGWAAAGGDLSAGAAVLFGILFLWQFPHVLAIAWLHREDYGRGGYRMLAVLDADGIRTGRRIAVYSVCLLLLSLTPPLLGMAGALYPVAALALGSAFLAAGLRFWRAPDRRRARTVMLASLAYLPLLWLLLLVCRP